MLDKRKRVVVTGMGLVSCLGSNIDEFYNQLLRGESGVKKIDKFPCADFSTRIAAGVKDVPAEAYIESKLNRRIDPYIRFTLVAGLKALENAKIDVKALDEVARQRSGVIVGTGVGGMQTQGDGFHAFEDKGWNRVSPFYCPFVLTNMGSALLGIEAGFKGPNYSVSTACATANYSIICAANHIRSGQVDMMLAGGAEASLSPMCLAGFMACHAVSKSNDEPFQASRPWDLRRDGFVMGEGSGVLLLESLDHALARGAPIIAEYLGGAMTCDAYHMTNPLPNGQEVQRCINLALNEAALSPSDIQYINAHATSTQVGDLAEIRALQSVFKSRSSLKMNSTKSMIGHALGAAGGIEAIVLLKALETQMLHPTINLKEPEPELMIDPVANVAAAHNIDIGMSNSFGFGGHNSVIIFSKYR
jgi:3-oxoacyl-[acyl-carrier-protein] synthase II